MTGGKGKTSSNTVALKTGDSAIKNESMTEEDNATSTSRCAKSITQNLNKNDNLKETSLDFKVKDDTHTPDVSCLQDNQQAVQNNVQDTGNESKVTENAADAWMKKTDYTTDMESDSETTSWNAPLTQKYFTSTPQDSSKDDALKKNIQEIYINESSSEDEENIFRRPFPPVLRKLREEAMIEDRPPTPFTPRYQDIKATNASAPAQTERNVIKKAKSRRMLSATELESIKATLFTENDDN
ncbi:hypothetical protein WMY93_031115 [Mugilogobius chulae]|uniref:Uncharacterized protein n=1 Tax=Mugilogobius chulae TaxID=88201 RepID=A0AAW0MIV6_9GOBI